MTVVDLTDSAHAAGASGPQSGDTSGHRTDQPDTLKQRKLGPQAAAAMQAGNKRKLPDSFRSQTLPKIDKSGQQKGGKERKARPPMPTLHRQPGMRITAQMPAENQAAMHPVPKVSTFAPAADTAVADNLARLQADSAVEQTGEEQSGSAQNQPEKPASQTKRLLPGSLTALKHVQQSVQATVMRPGLTAPFVKTGPTEHDTKVCSEKCKVKLHTAHRHATPSQGPAIWP